MRRTHSRTYSPSIANGSELRIFTPIPSREKSGVIFPALPYFRELHYDASTHMAITANESNLHHLQAIS